jgi:hypothetical protein
MRNAALVAAAALFVAAPRFALAALADHDVAFKSATEEAAPIEHVTYYGYYGYYPSYRYYNDDDCYPRRYYYRYHYRHYYPYYQRRYWYY